MGNKPDYLIKQKQDEKSVIVGAAWKKTGPYGEFFSLSIGPREGPKQSYIMVESKEDKPRPTRSAKPEAMHTPTVGEIIDDSLDGF